MAMAYCACQAGSDTTATTVISRRVETYSCREPKHGESERCLVCDRRVETRRRALGMLHRVEAERLKVADEEAWHGPTYDDDRK